MQAELFTKTCKICKHFKNRNTLYGNIPLKNITELKQCYYMHVDLIDSYSKYIIQHQPCVTVIDKNAILNCMTMIDPATGCLEIFEIPAFDVNDLTSGNDE